MQADSEMIRAEGAKKAADTLQSSDVAVELAKVCAHALCVLVCARVCARVDVCWVLG